MNVCVVGIGRSNIGTTISAVVSHLGHTVTMKTSRPDKWSNELIDTDMGSGETFTAVLDRVTANADFYIVQYTR